MTTMIDPPISKTDRTRNAASCQSTAIGPPPSPDSPEGGAEGGQGRGEQDRQEGEGDQPFPPDVEDLVDADPRHGPGDPHEDEVQEVDLEQEPDLVGDDRDRDDRASDRGGEGDEHG